MRAGVVDWVTPDIRRILAPNPSAMTGPGTNTYLIGQGKGLIVVDPGPENAAHMAAILSALAPDERVTSIVVTHAHKDHSTAAPDLSARTGAPVLAFGDARSGRSAVMQDLAKAGLTGGGEGVDHAFRPDRLLADGDVLDVSDRDGGDKDGGDKTVRVLHTPGHMGGHICLGFGDVLLSGDHAMGWASSLISPPDGDMRDYLASLSRLAAGDWSLMLPGHGPAVPQVAARLHALIRHRREREAQVMHALSLGPTDCVHLTQQIYHDVPPALHPAAQRNTLAHLIELTTRKAVVCTGVPGPQTIFTRADTP